MEALFSHFFFLSLSQTRTSYLGKEEKETLGDEDGDDVCVIVVAYFCVVFSQREWTTTKRENDREEFCVLLRDFL